MASDGIDFISVEANGGSVGPTLLQGVDVQGDISSLTSTDAWGMGDKGLGWLMEVDDEGLDPNASLMEELDIDVSGILYKLRCVIAPVNIDREVLLQSPDFWGPMAVVLIYALLLVWGQFKVVSWVMTMWLFGSLLVFLLARVLGAEVSYAQTLGVIGYSLVPLVVAVVFLHFLKDSYVSWSIRVVSTCWATVSAAGLLANPEQMKNKHYLLLYPILLLYIYFISMQSGV
eukprot:TRINITY_DN6741_c0_g1_i1.p1 TRINITY_DN6741_c0_g1~~TRINITY_DN6741_c0_g1_i1.p1  ORF type:complete len:230 (+),score=40.07 TRINITY_DN6741_c0_g1_i1:399-1088(+)